MANRCDIRIKPLIFICVYSDSEVEEIPASKVIKGTEVAVRRSRMNISQATVETPKIQRRVVFERAAKSVPKMTYAESKNEKLKKRKAEFERLRLI